MITYAQELIGCNESSREIVDKGKKRKSVSRIENQDRKGVQGPSNQMGHPRLKAQKVLHLGFWNTIMDDENKDKSAKEVENDDRNPTRKKMNADEKWSIDPSLPPK